MPGVIAQFERGYAQGMIEALAVGLGLTAIGVSPQRWQKRMLPEDYEDTKKAAVIVAREKFPYIDLSTGKRKDPKDKDKRVPHAGIVDALLIGEWGRLSI